MTDFSNHRGREAEQLAAIKRGKMEPEMRALTAMLTDRLAKCDVKLRRCTAAEFPVLQAQAFVYEQLLGEINT